MNNNYESADWANNHQQLSDGIARGFHKLAYAFHRLNALQYRAPWRRSAC